jgi:hypothetical protein
VVLGVDRAFEKWWCKSVGPYHDESSWSTTLNLRPCHLHHNHHILRILLAILPSWIIWLSRSAIILDSGHLHCPSTFLYLVVYTIAAKRLFFIYLIVPAIYAFLCTNLRWASHPVLRLIDLNDNNHHGCNPPLVRHAFFVYSLLLCWVEYAHTLRFRFFVTSWRT